MPEEFELQFEEIIIKGFVDYINKRDDSDFQFDCRPDQLERGVPRQSPVPDFKYLDTSTNRTLHIEVGRITTTDIGDFKRLRDIYLPIEKEYDEKTNGSFLLMVDGDRVQTSKRGYKQNQYVSTIIEQIRQEIGKMSKDDYIRDIVPGVHLCKHSNEGHVFLVSPAPKYKELYPTICVLQKEMLHLFKEANAKFENFRTEGNTNVLVILDTLTIFSEICDVIESMEIYGHTVCSDFPHLHKIYEIQLNPDWDIYPLGLSECYPDRNTGHWCKHSELFSDPRQYRNAFLKYFMGS